MKVTVCQIDCRPDELASTLTKLEAHTKSAGSDFLLLPEMCFSEWLAADRDPSEIKWLKAVEAHSREIAKLDRFGTSAVLGTRPTVHINGSRRNEAYLWQSTQGAVGFHEKYYLPDEEGYYEHTWYDRGDGQFEVARFADVRVGVQICTEMWFYEWARHYAASRADMLCIPRATPHGSVRKWLAGGQASAVCSGAYCLSSNLWAPKGYKANCGGLGWIVDPEGEILAETTEEEPFVTVEIDLDFARESKSTYPRYVPE